MRTRTRTILAGLVLAAALLGGVAWATIPDAAGVIHGCYKTNSKGENDPSKGELRVVDSASDCKSGHETAISWNEKGVAGATGAAGPAGPQGAKGDNGSDGAAGPQGAKGDTGAAGPAGAAGAPGTNGTNGTNGAKGDPCLATDPACVGPKGDTGAPGTNGSNGTNGTNGAKGDPCLATDPACVGPKGENGANGTNGAPGAKGDPCLATDPACVGPAGPAGTATTTYTTRSATTNTGTRVDVFCLEGERVTGGGGDALAPFGAVAESFPVTITQQGFTVPASGTNASGWRVSVAGSATGGTTGVSAYVICAS